MSNLTFFAKHKTLHRDDKHLLRGTSVIRGEQISEYLGAKLNPTDGFEDDMCIYVKPNTTSLYAGDIKLAKKSYIDVIDGHNLRLYLAKNPEIPGIACSQYDFMELSSVLRNPIVLIPQHTCNFERIRMAKTERKTVGIIGSRQTVDMIPADLGVRLKDIGLDFISYKDFRTRNDVIDFYSKIDIQVMWRPKLLRLSNPLKILNAASFGIPTVCYKERAHGEVEDICIGVDTVEQLLDGVHALATSDELYADYSNRCINKSEDYHISKIAELYKNL